MPARGTRPATAGRCRCAPRRAPPLSRRDACARGRCLATARRARRSPLPRLSEVCAGGHYLAIGGWRAHPSLLRAQCPREGLTPRDIAAVCASQPPGGSECLRGAPLLRYSNSPWSYQPTKRGQCACAREDVRATTCPVCRRLNPNACAGSPARDTTRGMRRRPCRRTRVARRAQVPARDATPATSRQPGRARKPARGDDPRRSCDPPRSPAAPSQARQKPATGRTLDGRAGPSRRDSEGGNSATTTRPGPQAPPSGIRAATPCRDSSIRWKRSAALARERGPATSSPYSSAPSACSAACRLDARPCPLAAAPSRRGSDLRQWANAAGLLDPKAGAVAAYRDSHSLWANAGAEPRARAEGRDPRPVALEECRRGGRGPRRGGWSASRRPSPIRRTPARGKAPAPRHARRPRRARGRAAPRGRESY